MLGLLFPSDELSQPFQRGWQGELILSSDGPFSSFTGVIARNIELLGYVCQGSADAAYCATSQLARRGVRRLVVLSPVMALTSTLERDGLDLGSIVRPKGLVDLERLLSELTILPDSTAEVPANLIDAATRAPRKRLAGGIHGLVATIPWVGHSRQVLRELRERAEIDFVDRILFGAAEAAEEERMDLVPLGFVSERIRYGAVETIPTFAVERALAEFGASLSAL